jgi:fatty acid desaturase
MSFYYLFLDLFILSFLFYISRFISLFSFPLTFILWFIWCFIQGTFMTSIWVIAHECGHEAFSSIKIMNDLGILSHLTESWIPLSFFFIGSLFFMENYPFHPSCKYK